MRRRGKRLLALALAGVMAASALTGCEKIEDTKAASGNTTAAKAADEGKAGEQPGAGETQKEAAVEAVRRVGLCQKKEVERACFAALPQYYEMFCHRLELLKTIAYS